VVIELVVAGPAVAQFVRSQKSMWKMMTGRVCEMKGLWIGEQGRQVQIRSRLILELLALVSRHLDQSRVCCLEAEVWRRWVSQHGYCAGLPDSWLL
jgi:hypothetical protein